MRVYLAAPWVRKEDARRAAKQMTDAGIEITSHWLDHEGDPNDATGAKSDIDRIREQAIQDIADVEHADYFVVLNLEKSEGKAVETGIAIANGIQVVSVGTRSNIFQTLGIEVETLEAAIDYILQRS